MSFINLSFATLTLTDLSSADLSSADLSFAFLGSTDFSFANLNSANLTSAIFTSANLSFADLRNGNASLAITAVQLQFATVVGVDLSGNNLSSFDLSGLNLNSAILGSSDLSSANLTLTNLSSANLSFADLSFADLYSSNLSSADLSSADLSSADLSFANLTSADLQTTTMSGATLLNTTLTSANLNLSSPSGQTDLSAAILTNATLAITGATVDVDDVNVLDTLQFDSGTLNVSGVLGFTLSSSSVISSLTIDSGKTLNVTATTTISSNGSLTLQGGTLTTETLSNAGTFDFTGGVLHVDTYNGSFVNQGGTVAPGTSPGITNVTGNYDQQAGSLEIELFSNGGGSPVAGVDFDQLIADTVDLAGILELVNDASYTPTLGDVFQIISTTSGVSGTFGNVTGAYLGGGLGLDVLYNPNDVTVEVINVLLGDFDVNGTVDGHDFLKWQRDPSVGSLADWEANYGTVAPLSASSAAVPEPTTSALALAALCLAMSRRRAF